MSNIHGTLAALAACLLAGQQIAKAGDDDAALLAQVKQLAAQGQDAQTTAQVNQYVDQNQNVISSILSGYARYIKQVQAMTDDSVSGAPVATGQAAGTAAPAVQQDSGAPQTSEVQPSTALRTSEIQPSGGLRTAHLAGYPALPDVDPTSSVTTLTAEQREYTLKVQQENKARKQYLMQHPEGYTY
jgi:hypothetical protein